MTSNFKLILIAGTLAIMGATLSGCGLGSVLSNEKKPPDEFAVVTKAPLVIPPDYALKPPRPGARRPQENTPSEIASRSVFNVREPEPVSTDGKSRGEMLILQATGADQVDSSIRREVDAETIALQKKSNSFTNQIMFWQDGGAPGKVIDPAAERERIIERDAVPQPVPNTQSSTEPTSSVLQPAPEPYYEEPEVEEEEEEGGFFSRIGDLF